MEWIDDDPADAFYMECIAPLGQRHKTAGRGFLVTEAGGQETFFVNADASALVDGNDFASAGALVLALESYWRAREEIELVALCADLSKLAEQLALDSPLQVDGQPPEFVYTLY